MRTRGRRGSKIPKILRTSFKYRPLHNKFWLTDVDFILQTCTNYLCFKIQTTVNSFGDIIAQHGNINLSQIINISREIVRNHPPSNGFNHVPYWRLELSLLNGLYPICKCKNFRKYEIMQLLRKYHAIHF